MGGLLLGNYRNAIQVLRVLDTYIVVRIYGKPHTNRYVGTYIKSVEKKVHSHHWTGLVQMSCLLY